MRRCHVLLAVLLLLPLPASAVDLQLPAGFTTHMYVTGDGFHGGAGNVPGIPAVSTMAFDVAGAMYLGRTGRRYTGGEIYDLWPIYRIPPGGGHLTPSREEQFLYGPPLPNAQVGVMRDGRELFVSAFDRDRGIGAVYRLVDGRAELFAGGTPPPGQAPLLRQPEAVALGPSGHVYVADRAQGAVLRLDATGAVVDPEYVSVRRPRLLASAGDVLWVGADGSAVYAYRWDPHDHGDVKVNMVQTAHNGFGIDTEPERLAVHAQQVLGEALPEYGVERVGLGRQPPRPHQGAEHGEVLSLDLARSPGEVRALDDEHRRGEGPEGVEQHGGVRVGSVPDLDGEGVDGPRIHDDPRRGLPVVGEHADGLAVERIEDRGAIELTGHGAREVVHVVGERSHALHDRAAVVIGRRGDRRGCSAS